MQTCLLGDCFQSIDSLRIRAEISDTKMSKNIFSTIIDKMRVLAIYTSGYVLLGYNHNSKDIIA